MRNKKYMASKEKEFVENYFGPAGFNDRWLYNSVTFWLEGKYMNSKYTPDFYDVDRDVFIEVSGTRQAYHGSKVRYDMLRKQYPNLKFEIRQPSGKLLNEEGKNKNWE